MKNKKILAIETSCDETAAAVVECEDFKNVKVLSSVVYSQIKMHKITKGVVPEVASRAHIEKIIPVIKKAVKDLKVILKDFDTIAVTVGPGLIGSLLVGIDTAKTLSFVLNKPLIPINHIEAHIYANFVGKSKILGLKSKIFPAVVLIVSGGHTQLVLMRGHGNYKLLGSTIDDAAGEAFDKVASILGLGYPGGPSISKIAGTYKRKPKSYKLRLPRPMIDSSDFDFSFSGLKTAVLYLVRNLAKDKGVTIESLLNNHRITAAIAFEFQQAVVDVLAEKTIKAARVYKAKTVMLGGGVAANQHLRKILKQKIKKIIPRPNLFIPAPDLCTDNAVVIGVCACCKLICEKNKNNWQEARINLKSKI